ncbi:hypothetical protein RYX36_023530 [Vicia faba]
MYLTKLAEQAKRCKETISFMQKLVLVSTPSSEFSVKERNLISAAYKKVIGSLHAVWRIISSIEKKEEGRKNDDHIVLVKDYRSKVKAEFPNVCASILELNLIPSGSSSESKVLL